MEEVWSCDDRGLFGFPMVLLDWLGGKGGRPSSAVGWMAMPVGRSLHAFRCEMDLLIAGGNGGEGFALSYGPRDVDAMLAAVEEAP